MNQCVKLPEADVFKYLILSKLSKNNMKRLFKLKTSLTNALKTMFL